MATSVSDQHKAYKKRGGKKSFAEFRKSTLAAHAKSSTQKTATKRAKKASKMVSGKITKLYRKPIKRKLSM